MRLPPRLPSALFLCVLALSAPAWAQDIPDVPPVEVPADVAPVDPAAPAAEELPAAPESGSAATPMEAADQATEAAPAAEAGEPAPAGSPTQAEEDYAAIYGGQVYDPIADPTLPPPAQLPTSYDPWEKWNRRMHRFNNAVDRRVAKPLAEAYVAAVPRPVRLGVRNFFHNLGQPLSALNALLQGQPKRAAQALGRFALNSTLGIGGLFDPATDAHLPNHGEDFGQTLGVWGWKRSRYVELPLFGPRTVRDVFGMAGDAPLSPVRQVDNDPTRVFLQGLQLVDIRTQLFAVDSMREGATDDYALVRDAWLQRRNYQIFGDRDRKQDAALPEYLQDDTANPVVPVDAIPVPQPN
jgi:phospholipid-binding lipoprotein MlaA